MEGKKDIHLGIFLEVSDQSKTPILISYIKKALIILFRDIPLLSLLCPEECAKNTVLYLRAHMHG